MVLKAVWDLNNVCYRTKIPSVTILLVNECSYRIMSVFRMAASDLGSDFKSNLAPTEIYMVC